MIESTKKTKEIKCQKCNNKMEQLQHSNLHYFRKGRKDGNHLNHSQQITTSSSVLGATLLCLGPLHTVFFFECSTRNFSLFTMFLASRIQFTYDFGGLKSNPKCIKYTYLLVWEHKPINLPFHYS